MVSTLEVDLVSKNHEISLKSREMWARNVIVVDNVFAYTIAFKITNDEEPEPRIVEEC